MTRFEKMIDYIFETYGLRGHAALVFSAMVAAVAFVALIVLSNGILGLFILAGVLYLVWDAYKNTK